MAEPINKVVDVEKVVVAPAGGENVDDPNEGATGDGGAASEGQGGEGEGTETVIRAGRRVPKEELIDHSKPASQTGAEPEGGSGQAAGAQAAASEGKNKVGPDGLKDVEGETPRERALRAELALTRGQLRKERGQELGIEHTPQGQQAPAKKEPSAQSQEVLKKYKPSEIAAFREVLPAIAEELGFVKAADLSQQTYAQQSQAVLDEFLEAHPEYSAENDKDGVLWNAFKGEYGLYNKPANPKDFAKIFNRIHTSIFGIKPAGDKGPINAAQQKINVASHAGASGPSRSSAPARSSANAAGLRLDGLRGFTQEELDDIASRA